MPYPPARTFFCRRRVTPSSLDNRSLRRGQTTVKGDGFTFSRVWHALTAGSEGHFTAQFIAQDLIKKTGALLDAIDHKLE